MSGRKWTKRLALLWIAALLTLLLLPAAAAGEGEAVDSEAAGEEQSLYMENEWNFVDASMDVSGGIPENARGVLADILYRGVLRVATEPFFPPQEFIDPNLSGQESYVGSDMELARLIARRMGVELQIVPMDFSEVLTAVAEGKCDLAISGLSYTPGRAARMTLSKGYNFADGNAGSGLMIRAADSDRITGVDSLKGLNIAAQSGSLQEAQMYENVFHYREFRRLSQVQELYDALMNGSIDAAMVDYESGSSYIEGNPQSGLMMVPDLHFTQEEQFDGDRIAAKKGEESLVAFVNGVIDEVVGSGQYRAWFEEYTKTADELGM